MSQPNYNNHKYDPVKDQIDQLILSGHDKERIKYLTVQDGISPEQLLGFFKLDATFPQDLTQIQWQEIFNFQERKNKKIVGLIKGAVNDAEINHDPGSQWGQYKKALRHKKFSTQSIQNLEQSSIQILRQLSKNTKGEEAVKGLVVGSVQSGKTANMIGLMSMAADYGFNFFIVFSGVIDNLRIQTENRMFKDLNLNGALKWNKLSNPSLKSLNPELKWQNIHLNPESIFFSRLKKQITYG